MHEKGMESSIGGDCIAALRSHPKGTSDRAGVGSGLMGRTLPADDPAAIAAAAAALRAGGLVAFPTETVYGLGANARDPAAVARIFAAKGRPATNPLIVHVADAAAARELVSVWSPVAEALAARFWPGPLTLVLPKGPSLPDLVTAGGPTVGIRIPAHPAARALLRAAGVPVAAPSANRSTEVSPTTAAHVAASLGEAVDLILDGGPTTVGLESTVLDVSVSPPQILRPGMVTRAMLEEVVGDVAEDRQGPQEGPARSPGLMTRHYAPRAPVVVLPAERLGTSVQASDGLLCRETAGVVWRAARVIAMPLDVTGYAARMYAALREMDTAGVARIVVEAPPEDAEWAAVRDRLRRASAKA